MEVGILEGTLGCGGETALFSAPEAQAFGGELSWPSPDSLSDSAGSGNLHLCPGKKLGVRMKVDNQIILFIPQKIIDLLQSPLGASRIAQLVENLSAMEETPVQFLGQEDLLEKV